jgi:hypothetical protein
MCIGLQLNTCFFGQILIKKVFWADIRKSSNIRFYNKAFCEADLFRADGQTDGQLETPDEASSHFPPFCEVAKERNITLFLTVKK